LESDIKILIIDSIAYNRVQIKNILSFEKYLIIEALSIPEGVSKLQIYKPDIVIIDTNLIKNSGINIISMFFAQKKDVKIIAYNIFEKDLEFEEALKRNHIQFIVNKPITKEKILKAIDEALRANISVDVSREKEDIRNINFQIVKTVIDTIVEVLKIITGKEVIKGRLYFLPVAFTTMGIGSIIDFKGDFDGKIMIDMPSATAKFFASKMLLESIEEIDDVVKSSIAELINTVAGRIASNLAKFGNIKISIPKIITNNIDAKIFQDKKIFVFPLGVGEYLTNVNFFITFKE